MSKKYFLFTTICLMLFLVGCNKNATPPSSTSQKKLEVEQSSYEPDNIMNTKEIASHLATIASEVPDVHDAAAIVAGPYAVVAIDISQEVERQETGKIKYSVLEAMEHDPYGRSAVVIADADMLQRIKEMKNSIRDGAPVQGVADELGNIVSRYMPTFPIDDNAPRNDVEEDNLIDKEKGLE